MDNKNLLKAAIMLLGGFLVFALVKPKNKELI
jgi:hypothetical protein